MMPLNRTCKQVAAMLVAREDRHLSLADRLALRIHMAICDACPHFERQILTMRNGLRQWRNYQGQEDSGHVLVAAGPPQGDDGPLGGQ